MTTPSPHPLSVPLLVHLCPSPSCLLCAASRPARPPERVNQHLQLPHRRPQHEVQRPFAPPPGQPPGAPPPGVPRGGGGGGAWGGGGGEGQGGRARTHGQGDTPPDRTGP